jgi:hypothetical protein
LEIRTLRRRRTVNGLEKPRLTGQAAPKEEQWDGTAS